MKQNTTYKQTELGLIPEDWEVKKLGKVGEIDKKSLNSNTDKEYEFDYISLSDVDSDQFSIKTSKQKFKNAPSRARRIVKKGDVLLSTVRPNLEGFTIIRDEVKDLIASTGFAVITSKNELHNEYLFNFLFSNIIKRQFHKLLVGSNYPAINSSDVKNLKIPLPPLLEQKKIADCLSTWDCAIEKQSQLINALTQRKKALMQQLLTGKKRLPGFSGEWKEVKLGDLFEKINRKNEEGNTNVVTISAQRGFVKQTDFFNKSVASETLDNYSLIYHGEFCYNKSYSNGYPLGATKRLIAFEKAVVTTLYICFKIKDQKKSNGSFFEQFFEANSLDRSLIKIAQEGGRAHGLLNVSLSDFFNIKIKLPPIEEQTAIAEILAAADRELQLQKEKLAQLQAQKKGLMQVLLTGKKRLLN